MANKIKLGDKLMDVDSLSEEEKAILKLLQFSDFRIQELTNIQKALQRASDSYLHSLQREILSAKAGLSLNDD